MSAWVITPKQKQTSFIEIMSEQLVTQLNTPSSTPSTSTSTSLSSSSSLPSSNLSIELNSESNYEFNLQNEEQQIEQQQIEEQLLIEEEINLNEIDSDYAFALALQEMEDYETSLNQQNQLNNNDEFSKINVTTSLIGDSNFAARKGANILDEDLDSYASLTDHRVINGLRAFEQKRHHKGIAANGRVSAKDSKITIEGVLDPTTRMIVYKLIQNNHLDKIYGVIKTGKEANVYHAYRQPDSYNLRQNNNPQSAKFHWNKQFSNFAVKIFKINGTWNR